MSHGFTKYYANSSTVPSDPNGQATWRGTQHSVQDSRGRGQNPIGNEEYNMGKEDYWV